jgi:hypothetical protein
MRLSDTPALFAVEVYVRSIINYDKLGAVVVVIVW